MMHGATILAARKKEKARKQGNPGGKEKGKGRESGDEETQEVDDDEGEGTMELDLDLGKYDRAEKSISKKSFSTDPSSRSRKRSRTSTNLQHPSSSNHQKRSGFLPRLSNHLDALNISHKAAALGALEHDQFLLPQSNSHKQQKGRGGEDESDPSTSSSSFSQHPFGPPPTSSNAGHLEPENHLDRLHRLTQSSLASSVPIAVQKRNQLKLGDDVWGGWEHDWSRDGRWLLIGGRKGMIGTVDLGVGDGSAGGGKDKRKVGTEFYVKETVRDVKWLHSHQFFAVAQKRHVYVYDSQGLEIHQMRNHVEVNRMEFLSYHFLLTTIGNPGILRYQDTSTGQIVAEHKTKLGKCDVMAQDRHTGIIYLGHSNGTITLRTPSLSTPPLTMLTHISPLTSISLDPSSGGNRLATSGMDGTVKVWDMRMMKCECLREWKMKKPIVNGGLRYSDKGLLAAGWAGHVYVYKDSHLGEPLSSNPTQQPPLYMTHLFPSSTVQSLSFRPYEDILGVGHLKGFETMIVPGAGEPNLDSREADPFESKNRRREREVRMVLEKLPPETITMDPELVGKLNPSTSRTPVGPNHETLPYARKTRVDRIDIQAEDNSSSESEADEPVSASDDEDGTGGGKNAKGKTWSDPTTRLKKLPKTEKDRNRGRKRGLKRYLKGKQANVTTKETEAVKAKLARRREEAETRRREKQLEKTGAPPAPVGALDRFAMGKRS